MPEGDTVHLAARRLGSALAGQTLTRTDFRVPAIATVDLSGQSVREVLARGKHILIRTDAELSVHSHFKMDGAWHLYRHGERWRGPDHQVRAVLETDAWVAVGFRLGVLEVLPTDREDDVVGHLGPDVLGPDWDAVEAVRRLAVEPDLEIGVALIDQRVLAGPGNVYKSESLFLRGVHPWTPAGDIELGPLVALVKRLMEANRGTGMQITTGDRRPGQGRWVYGRGGEACRRCGTPIERGMQGPDLEERVTYWCPCCQPEGVSTPEKRRIVRPDRLLARLRAGSFTNVRFADALRLAELWGFEVRRVSGSHHILGHRSFRDLVNLQEVRGQAKPYQLRQLLRLVERYDLDQEREHD